VYTGPEFVLVAGNNSLGDLAPGTVGEVTAVRDSGELRVKVPADDIIGLRSHSHDAIHYAALAYTSCELEPVDLTLATVEQVEHWTVTKRTLSYGSSASSIGRRASCATRTVRRGPRAKFLAPSAKRRGATCPALRIQIHSRTG
jgi:hypothetical protein